MRIRQKGITAVVAGALVFGLPAQAQDWGRPEGYENRRLDATVVNYSGGRFEYQGRGRWVEYGTGPQVKASFEELSRSAEWIDLNDASRDVQVRLNIKSRVILITESGGPYRLLYPIQSVSNRQPQNYDRSSILENLFGITRSSDRPREETREIEAGQWLVNQFDAQRVCPGVAARAGGEWTGAYRATRPTVMSVCTVRLR